ncbi:MAG: alpha/beta hydrolase [Burkholderiaceae bacterium]|jgi:pimeloyl-ACP methyl ester carboxylesterase|nr:alpha/beta hydrolase [Burkholderiaceae bacterium]
MPIPEPALHHITVAQNRRLAWWQWGTPDAPHLVVCMHGLTRQGRDFDVIAAALVARAQAQGRAIRVVCPDVAGRGQSDPLPDPQAYLPLTYVADMLPVLADLQRRAPIAALDWIGTSMGGIMGMLLAGSPQDALPAPVRRLVLNDVGPELEWAALQRIGTYIGRVPVWATVEEAAAALRVINAGFGPHSDAAWLELSRHCLRAMPDGRWQLSYDPAIAQVFSSVTPEANAKATAALWQFYDRITAQVLLIRGGDSDLLTPVTAQAMAARGPRAKVIEFAGVGHAPTLIAPDQQRAVLDFLLPEHAEEALEPLR